jgi:rod shape-determining protein MreC
LIAGHLRWGWLQAVESRLSALATPFYWLADVPYRLGDWSRHSLQDWRSLKDENDTLRQEKLILTAQVAKMAALSAENARLRQLLNSAAHVDDSVLIAELVAVAPDPLRHIVVINKGEDAGVYVGQAVIDGHGLVGQVIEVSRFFSRVLQVSDTTHAVPVQVNRNGVRAIAEGTGLVDSLQVAHVASSTDIKVGDLLVTSGLGGGFPPGYPVAIVTEVSEGDGQPFLRVKAKPTAHLDQSRHLLLVFRPATDSPALPDTGDDAAGVNP